MIKSRNIRKKLGDADPVFSMGQRIWDFVQVWWPGIVTFFATGGGVTLLAYITDWAKALGPLGIGLLAIGAALSVFLLICAGLWLVADRRLRREQASVLNKWKEHVDNINPLDFEFTRKRINVLDLVNPITRKASKKRLIDCELMGPGNIIIISTAPGAAMFNRVRFTNCDVVVVNEKSTLYNVVALEDLEIIGGEVFNISIYIHRNMIPVFASMGTHFASLTGIEEIDKYLRPGMM